MSEETQRGVAQDPPVGVDEGAWEDAPKDARPAGTQGAGIKKAHLVLAFALGAALAAVIALALPRGGVQATQGAAPAAEEQAAEPTEGQADDTTGTEQADDAGQADASAASAGLDIATTFPSWDPESESLAELVAFVQDVTDPASPNYREPAERVATFDMDGTIIAEKAPLYVDYMLLIHRVLDDPTHEAAPEVVEVVEKIRDEAMAGNKNSEYSPAKHVAIAHEFAGMTPEEFRSYVVDFVSTEPVVGFDGMTYLESLYQPMLEVIDYLRANGFDVWMVSACEREVTRAIVATLGIDPSHVVATNVAYATTGQGEEPEKKYTMEQGELVVMAEPLSEESCEKNGKVTAIAREIGRAPLLAFGNSSGDYAMLNYAESAGGMGLLVVADDEVRDYGSAEKSAEQYQLVADEHWTAFSMAEDWATIYGEGVTKTELPGLAEGDEG